MTLELKIPPPAVMLFFGALMFIVASYSDFATLMVSSHIYLALGCGLAGLLAGAVAFFSFRSAGTTVNPTKPNQTSSLIVSGIYKFSRNPMYLGLLIVLLGWAIFLANVFALVFLPVFVLYINRFQIEPEERMLALKFGSEYADYKAKVRRWL